MNRLVMIAVIAVIALIFYRTHDRVTRVQAVVPHRAVPEAAPPRFSDVDPSSQFHCDGRVYCSQMTSRAEAVYFTRHCPGTKMDGDNDGIPCENDSRF